MKQNKEVKNEKVLSLKGNKNYAKVYLGEKQILYINLFEEQGLSIKTTDIWNKNFDKIELYTSLDEPSVGLSASFNGVLNNKETLKLLWQLREGQRLVNMINFWLEKSLKNIKKSTDNEAVENSVPPEYDVKVGDIAIVTEYCGGNNIGELVKVVEVIDISSMNHGGKYNSVKTVNQKGEESYENDVKLHSSHARTKSN